MNAGQKRTALVTGAGGTMGAATARRLAADGYRVALVDVSSEAIKKIAGELGNAAYAAVEDVSDAKACDRTVE